MAKMGWATFLGFFQKTHLVTLHVHRRKMIDFQSNFCQMVQFSLVTTLGGKRDIFGLGQGCQIFLATNKYTK
jgi:hypothetical protein